MTCRLFGANPLSKPMTNSHQPHPKEQTHTCQVSPNISGETWKSQKYHDYPWQVCKLQGGDTKTKQFSWTKYHLDLSGGRGVCHIFIVQPTKICVIGWGWMTHVSVSKRDNRWLVAYSALSHYRKQCKLIVNWNTGTNFSEISIEHQTFLSPKIHLKMSSAKLAVILCRPQCVKTPFFLCRWASTAMKLHRSGLSERWRTN